MLRNLYLDSLQGRGNNGRCCSMYCWHLEYIRRLRTPRTETGHNFEHTVVNAFLLTNLDTNIYTNIAIGPISNVGQYPACGHSLGRINFDTRTLQKMRPNQLLMQ